MFVDFDKIFKKKTQNELPIPDSLLAHMSKSLPEGLSYTASADGNCYIVADSGEVNITGLIFRPTDEQRAILGDHFTIDELMEYMYNSQQQIRLELKTPGTLILNGKEIPVSQFVQNPFKQLQIVDGSFVSMPKPFPPPFELTIASEKYHRQVKMQRVANESVDTAKFISDADEPFVLSYYANKKAMTIQFNVSLNLKAARTIYDFVTSVSIYNAFVDGRATMDGQPIQTKVSGEKEKRFDDRTIVFWEKVLEIEKYLNVSFVPPAEDIDYETICLVEQLYQSFIFNRPTRELKRVNSITGTWVADGSVKPEDCIGQHLFFSFDGESKINLFGVELNLYCIIGQCNAVVTDYVVNEDKYTMAFGDLDQDKPLFSAVLYFKDETSMKACRDNVTTLADDMHKAQKPNELIS